MGDIVPIKRGLNGDMEANSWRVRDAVHADVPAVAAAVGQLLVELGGRPAAQATLEKTVRAVIDAPEEGAVLVAENEGEIVGMVGVSWQIAIRIPGRYGLIQELWVDPEWRYRTIGADLIVALCEFTRQRGVTRLEVGLPSERFPHVTATESFYQNNGFSPIGLRMRRQC